MPEKFEVMKNYYSGRYYWRLKDANGEIDYGNIDTFVLSDGLYILDGDWGNMEIKAQSVNIVYQ